MNSEEAKMEAESILDDSEVQPEYMCSFELDLKVNPIDAFDTGV